MSGFKAEIISIGNEVLAGYTVNTNATFISQQLQGIGLPVYWVSTIRDEHEHILYALRTARERANVILVTGGLGPTPDDITKKTVAEFFDVPLEINRSVLKDVEKFVRDHGRELTEVNRNQALIPRCDDVIRNPMGTAPGLVFRREGRLFYFMPGVPREMKNMVRSFVLQDIRAHLALPQVTTHLFRTTGIPESYLYDRIKSHLPQDDHIDVSFLPREFGVDLRFRLISDDRKQQEAFNARLKDIREALRKYIFAEEEIELQEALGRILRNKGLTLAVAESFTGGLIGDWITDVPGSSDYFSGDLVTYSNESKIQLLNVRPETLQRYGAVSEQTVLEMVRGAQKRFCCDCAIATTGIAGPGGGSPQKPVGLCYIAARFKDKETVKEFRLGTVRRTNKKRGAVAGMEMLRRLLLDI
ncbi:MAG TPA: competence/damage-inducible protein A [Caldithrix abyssi]|uniref:CinA-like protein n=1 Tax=Caldithrix abyssi TaxID=187145 RepID=A0A7V5UE06_CALAY|nr:competence/damage-inducible protein A [Caldithrix abyssi]